MFGFGMRILNKIYSTLPYQWSIIIFQNLISISLKTGEGSGKKKRKRSTESASYCRRINMIIFRPSFQRPLLGIHTFNSQYSKHIANKLPLLFIQRTTFVVNRA